MVQFIYYVKHTHRHTQETLLWRILKGRWKTAPEGFVSTRALRSFFFFFFIFFFFPVAQLPTGRGEWLCLLRASIDLHSGLQLNNSAHTNMAGGQSLWSQEQDIHLYILMTAKFNKLNFLQNCSGLFLWTKPTYRTDCSISHVRKTFKCDWLLRALTILHLYTAIKRKGQVDQNWSAFFTSQR